MGTYPRPRPTPVANLRPAPQTCEQCHWPKKFWGAQLKVFTHYGSDEQNTPRVIRMLIKTGGGDPAIGQAGEGIHWHMNITANKITYFATDEQRQVIPWCMIEDQRRAPSPESRHHQRQTADAGADRHGGEAPHGLHRLPQPSHAHLRRARSLRGSPGSITGRTIDASLPYIKQQGVQVLTADYKTTDKAEKAIAADNINKFYQRESILAAAGFQQGRQHQGFGCRTAAHLSHHLLP